MGCRVFPDKRLHNHENNFDPHEPNFILLGALGKKDSTGKSDLRNLSESEEPPEAPDEQGVTTYIKKLATYVSDL